MIKTTLPRPAPPAPKAAPRALLKNSLILPDIAPEDRIGILTDANGNYTHCVEIIEQSTGKMSIQQAIEWVTEKGGELPTIATMYLLIARKLDWLHKGNHWVVEAQDLMSLRAQSNSDIQQDLPYVATTNGYSGIMIEPRPKFAIAVRYHLIA